MQSRPSSPALDSCLKLVWEHDPENGKFNPDSVMVDTCDAERTWYAKRGFRICVAEHVLDTSCGDPREFQELTCVDTTHPEYIRLLQLDTLFGSYQLAWIDTWRMPDSTIYGHEYAVEFDHMHPLRTISDTLYSWFPSTFTRFHNQTRRMHYKQEGEPPSQVPGPNSEPWGLPIGNPIEAGPIQPVEHEKNMWSRMYQRGFLSPLYDLKVPMAWHITMGSPTVYLAFCEGGTGSGLPFEHDDLHLVENGGNFFRKQSGSQPQRTLPLLRIESHLHFGMGMSSAELNGKGTVGVAPKCRVLSVFSQSVFHLHSDVTGDLIVNPSMPNKYPHVMNNSESSGAVGNYNSVTKEFGDAYWRNMNSGAVAIQGLSVRGGHPVAPQGPSDISYFDPTDDNDPEPHSKYDVKLLAVGYCSSHYQWAADRGQSMHRSIENDDCSYRVNPFGGLADIHGFGNMHSNKFSTGLKTGSTKVGRSQRNFLRFLPNEDLTKSQAALDVVVPSWPVTITSNSDGESLYATDAHGVFGQAVVAGTVGLMMSVQDRLGQSGIEVHKRAYNIITFTADKIVDPLGDSKPVSELAGFSSIHASLMGLGANSNKLRTSYRSMRSNEYGVENYDHLDRYWAIRMGFGRLNAFRSVAHSIPGVGANDQPNVKFTYAGTDNLDWANAHEMDGNNGLGTVKYLHLGKYKNATDLVLEHGGVKFTGEPDYLNSNGKTIVNKNLSVGSAQGLVIDGIVDTDVTDNTPYPAITTTSESGRILITGWLRRVRLDGRIYAVDLRVVNDGAGEAPKLVCRGGQSELHDTLWLRNNTKLVVEDGGTLDLMPGAIVIMSQGSSITVKSGGKVNLHHAARIVPAGTYTTQQPTVTLEGGGEMATVYRTVTEEGITRVAEQSENIVIETRLSLDANSTLRVKQCVDFVYPSLDVYVITADPAANIILEPNAYLRQRNQATSGVAGGIRFPTLVSPPTGVEARYRVDIPTTIPAGPLVVVPQGTNLELGRVKVEYNGGVKVSPGATLTLLEKEVEWNGILHVQGTSGNRATVRAAMELDQNLCGQALASRRAWPTLLKMIPGEFPYKDLNYNDSRAITTKLGCYLLLDQSQMINVFTQVQSMPIVGVKDGNQTLGYAANTLFKANRNDIRRALIDVTDLTTASTIQLRRAFLRDRSTMLDISRNRSLIAALRNERRNATSDSEQKTAWSIAWARMNALLGKIEISSCKFRDDFGMIEAASNYTEMQPDKWAGDHEAIPLEAYYVINAMGASGLTRVRVDASHFANLTTGVSIKAGEPDLTVTESNFANVVEGVVARGNHAQICNSNFSRTRIGVSSVRGTVRVNECSFGEGMSSSTNGAMISSETAGMMGIGVELDESMLWARSNDFRDYNTAIRALGVSQVWLRDRRTCLGSNCNTIEVDGRNRFRGMTTGEGETPFWKQSQWADLLWHVKQDETKPDYFVHCGLNDHSGQLRTIVNDNVLYHNYLLTRDDPNSTTTASVNPNDNEFNTDQATQRVLNVVLSPALTERDKEWLTEDDCEPRLRNAQSNPELECVPFIPNPPGELEVDSWLDLVHTNQMGQIPAPVVAQLRPANVDPSTLTEQERQDYLFVSNNYWRYDDAPWSNRSEWLLMHLQVLEADTLWPSNTDSVISAMSTVLTDTNAPIALRRQILPIMETVFIERENCAGATTLHANMMPELYSSQDLESMFFTNSTIIMCDQDSSGSDSSFAVANRELFAYIHRDQVAESSEKRRDPFEASNIAEPTQMLLRVAPNPATDVLRIEFQSGVNRETFYTIDISGVLGSAAEGVTGTVRGSGLHHAHLSVSHLPRGVYVLRLLVAGKSTSSLVVIQ